MRSLWVSAVALIAGCSGAHFDVHVRDARVPAPIARASVLLFDVRDDVCTSGASGGRLTDANGNAAVDARWCGAAKLVVAAHGYAPVTRELDSCDAGAIVVELAPFGPEAAGNDDARVRVARELLAGVFERDKVAIERVLADSSQVSLYLTGDFRDGEKPRAVRFAGLDAEDGVTTAQFDFFYEDGCRQRWRVDVILGTDGYRVTELTLAGP